MNGKILTLLIVLIAAVSMASVCAAELTKENDFDGLFKMKIAENETFNVTDNGNNFSSLLQSRISYKNDNESIFVFYYENELADAILYASQGNITNFDKDGDLGIINATEQMIKLCDGKVTVLAAKNPTYEKRTVFVGGTNETLVKEYANTIEFTK
ncbi:hypothetical protein [Methanobrevibacter sp.]|uniref:hypothetical protein n=1 Tax=Methanobrevibacter sp. TaxID=66852 RepID=UPI00388F867A